MFCVNVKELPLIIIIIIIDFFVGNVFPYCFYVHLNILDKVVSSLYAIFGTPVYVDLFSFILLVEIGVK
jgi:hypothetical protein